MLGRKDDPYAAGGSNNMTNDGTAYGTNHSHKGIKSSPWFQKLLRITQTLSAIISLALFSTRIIKILRLSKKLSQSNGAVEGN